MPHNADYVAQEQVVEAAELFRHSQVAYENARDMMLRTGKAVVIHQTGTGKSFVAFQLALENPDKRIYWMSLSKYIFKM